MKESDNRLIVVHNAHSSANETVHRDVFRRLDDEGVDYIKIETPSSDAGDLSGELIDVLDTSDRMLAAGGDGTYKLVLNALSALDDIGVELGLMAFGNRCDGAALTGKKSRDVIAMASDLVEPTDYYPLHYKATYDDGKKIEELALSYVTVGQPITQGADYFNSDVNRARMAGSSRLVRFGKSGLLAAQYCFDQYSTFENFPNSTMLNGEELNGPIADIFALNGLRMATALRNPGRQYEGSSFNVVTSGFSAKQLAQLGLAVVRPSGLKGKTVGSLEVTFAAPHSTWLQADGEAKRLVDAQSVVVDKGNRSFKVLTTTKHM